ncbi:MAG: trypsin-like serine protease [Myxococcales bacterium]|nr:trypsin-like serine protease [Myxococcales bacterium]
MNRRTYIFIIAALCGSSACAGLDEPGLLSGGALGEEPTPADVEGKEEAIVGGSAFSGLPGVGALAYGTSTFCTGTLITPTRVLTAAHCLENARIGSMSFITGPSNRQIQTSTRVVRGVMHPSYDRNRLINDIAYVDLESAPPGVSPIGLLPANSMDNSWVGRDLLHVGYGNDDGRARTGGGVKRAVVMPINQVMSSQFRYGGGGRNTCNGDSGGPALYRTSSGEYLIAGVTSYGDRNCEQYGVNARSDVYLSFLGVSGGPHPDSRPDSSTPDSSTPDTTPAPGAPVAQRFTDSQSLPQGRAQFYDRIPVTPGSPFRASLRGTGDADLYVRWGNRPTASAFDCRPFAGDSNEVCELTVPSGVREAFVAVNGFRASTYTLDVTYYAR